ncbi:hypothetical protein [Streptococcus equi]|uniref:hypothetical protein n=1 Tax=Streptococcus equi TaxID=1336 RepID=UPI0013F5CCF7|nr:hypothetical protein [Streptococcus equi]MDI5990274.1 hypothetical protein [Streptococcus equi subsp. zooepidemicus]HEL0698138.1 hypothetical protein [Streptococcus equi subsp. zooepidemicus]HEL0807803.1 hypothetical protein [Streptococcus equi subsp. zooepidemicus]HEL1074014.1 hypothetical protein [Streptococcus equi subsp. zooepidemicus]HEL1116293.1 hypothetical protein [Streptococcus equi subsp. zooepidemicus]
MIDRSYLPFQSAREYQDVGMQKWMGFFLSEHTSSLSDDANKMTYQSDLTIEMKYLLLGQLYTNQLTAQIMVSEKNSLKKIVGNVSTFSSQYATVKTKIEHHNIPINNIISIDLLEETLHESA